MRRSGSGRTVPGKPNPRTARGNLLPAFIETLPGDREHTIFKRDTFGMFDNMHGITVPPGHLFVMGDNRDNSADSRVPLDEGGVGLLPVSDLVGRVDVLVGSWDLGVRSEPVWKWPAGCAIGSSPPFGNGPLQHVRKSGNRFSEKIMSTMRTTINSI